MKFKLIIISIFSVLLLVGCGTTKNIIPANDGIIIEYSSSTNFGTEEEMENYYYINLYSDKTLSWGRKNSGEEGKKVLSKKQYDKIVNQAFTEKFKSLGENISDDDVLDGNSVHITLYYNDGTTFKTGGSNPTNKEFTKLVQLLKDSEK